MGGIGLAEIAADVEASHSKAFDPAGAAHRRGPGFDRPAQYRAGKEEHLYSPMAIHLLQQSARTGDYDTFKQFSRLIDDEQNIRTLRGAFEMRFAEDGGVPLEEVESVDSIVRRFKNRRDELRLHLPGGPRVHGHRDEPVGGKSNTGEGGEMESRYSIGPDGENRCSAIKQVASGRFGVDSKYLVNAREIQIKMAQGAKPGEGRPPAGRQGLPVDCEDPLLHPWRRADFPAAPPRHLFDRGPGPADLRPEKRQQGRPNQRQAGLGGGSRDDRRRRRQGGRPGHPHLRLRRRHRCRPPQLDPERRLPWELGLAETHQTLIQNGLRGKVLLETDGKLLTGRDVAIAAMLGAEEFGFATAPLVAMGCVMMRVCNLDTCPMGIATAPNPELRKRFAGKPEYIMNFMRFVAQELREYMARLGVRTVDELVGRADLLKAREDLPPRVKTNTRSSVRRWTSPRSSTPLLPPTGTDVRYDHKKWYDFHLEKTVDQTVLLKKFQPALKSASHKTVQLHVSSTDRTVGTMFGSEITRGTAIPCRKTPSSSSAPAAAGSPSALSFRKG